MDTFYRLETPASENRTESTEKKDIYKQTDPVHLPSDHPRQNSLPHHRDHLPFCEDCITRGDLNLVTMPSV